jgi:hypothetical protein
MTLESWTPIKHLIEARALVYQETTPIRTSGPRKGKRAHLGDEVMPQVLAQSPALWVLYQQAIAAGLPSEFQKPRRPPATPTPKDQAWARIEALARAMVATSPTPLTLRQATARVVAADPSLYSEYERAHRRAKRADLGRSRRRKLGR